MCNEKVSKVVLVVLNILFILLGFGLLIPGILVLVDESAINDEVLPALQSVSFGVSNLGDMAKGLSITLIVIGSFVVVLSLIGCIGACCQVKLCLIIYIFVVFILLLGKLVVVILWIVFNSKVESTLKDELKTGLKKFTTDDLTSDEVSTGWNYLNMNFKCCGIEDPKTDYAASAWVTGGTNSGRDVPISCCTGVTSSSYTAPGSCPGTGTLQGTHTNNCYDAVKNFATKYSIAFICVGVFILLVEVFAIIFACILCKKGGKDQVV